MSRDMKPRKPTSKKKSAGGTLIGMFIGLVLGVGVAAGVVWYMNKSPLPFNKQAQAPANGGGGGNGSANGGKVVFTGFLGIYGETVIIDHGMGLQTLYSHLRQIDVKEGQSVKKGDILGKTGVTGLAVGDHLHFGMVLSGLEVIPIEWWDAKWLEDNVTQKLRRFGGEIPQ